MKNKWLAFSLLPLLALSSCGSLSSTFDLFLYDESDTFIKSLKENILAQFAGDSYSSNLYYAARSQSTQNEQILSSISRGDPLLIVNLVDRLAASAIIEKAATSNRGLIFINREPLKEDLANQSKCFYVGSDAEGAGKLQANLAEQLFPLADLKAKKCAYDRNGDGVIQVAVIRGEEGHQDTELRTKWCTQKLRDDGYDVSILTAEAGNWTPDGGYSAMKAIAENYYAAADASKANVELVFSNNDDMASGAIKYLQEASILKSDVALDQQPIQLIGVDGTATGRDLIQKGLMYGTVLNDAATQAKDIYTLGKAILSGASLTNFQQFDYVAGKILTKSNL
jgi:methyl-galactoside transport system substrate-binding protein